jgi:glucose/arabinose dehydrogenase
MKNTIVVLSLLVSLLGLLFGVNVNANNLNIVPIAENLPKSWAIAVSPHNRLFMTERSGVLHEYAIDESNNQAALNLVYSYELNLEDLYNEGQGGLMAIAFKPSKSPSPKAKHENNWVYLSYSFGNDDANGLKVIRVKLKDGKVTNNELLFTQKNLRDTPAHYGARIAFTQTGELLVATGDGFDYREKAQVKDSQLGKILKVNDSGQVSNYSLGHRNPQALIVLNDGQVISHEHGPEGGDEINLIKEGKNYGWPVITQGRDYIGGLISPFKEYEGMQQPDYNWTPSIAPSGMVYYENARFSALSGRLLITSLKYQQMHALRLNDSAISDEIVYFPKSGHRMRDITQTPSGRVFILSDGKGEANTTAILEIN